MAGMTASDGSALSAVITACQANAELGKIMQRHLTMHGSDGRPLKGQLDLSRAFVIGISDTGGSSVIARPPKDEAIVSWFR